MYYECIYGLFDDFDNKNNIMRIKYNQENKIEEFTEKDKIEMKKIKIKL